MANYTKFKGGADTVLPFSDGSVSQIVQLPFETPITEDYKVVVGICTNIEYGGADEPNAYGFSNNFVQAVKNGNNTYEARSKISYKLNAKIGDSFSMNGDRIYRVLYGIK